MSSNPFLSKEVSVKRIMKGIAISLPCMIMTFAIGSYYADILFPTKSTSKPLVLGTADISLLDPEDKTYYEGADIFTNDKWNPNGYIKIEKAVDTPQYDIQTGSIVKDKFDIGDSDYLYLECREIDKDSLSIPPYWPSCSLKLNNSTLTDNLRSDVVCEDYDNNAGCKQEIQLIIYENENLENKYLFFSTLDYVGSSYNIVAYELTKDTYSRLYFDFKTFISEDKLTRGNMDLYMAFTDDSKSDFRLITYFYDPSMQSISGIYNEWKVTNGRWLLDKKIVAM